MFIPNNTGLLARNLGFNRYGEPSFGEAKTVECGVVHLGRVDQKTSVRTDSSATRGNADETLFNAKILFPSYVVVSAGDRFVINGQKLRVTAIEPRYSVYGSLDHYEVDFDRWAD